MLRRIIRVLFGFIMACLAAAATTVVFADIQELRLINADNASELMSNTSRRVLFAAIQGAKFSAAIAFVGILIGEWRRIRSWSYYTLLALTITLLGFMAWYTGEQAGDPTIVNNYALTAFLTTGFVGGLIYWLLSGRRAGTSQARMAQYDFAKSTETPVKKKPDQAKSEPPKPTPQKSAVKPAKKDAAAEKAEKVDARKIAEKFKANTPPKKPSVPDTKPKSASTTSVPKTSTEQKK